MAFTDLYPSIENELNTLFPLIKKEMRIILHAGNENFFSQLQLSPAEILIYPAAVIYSAKAFRVSNPQKTIDRAKIAFYVSMASHLHQLYEHEPVASKILCGDYFLAKYCAAIVEADATNWLKPISNIICRIHENRIRFLLNPIDSIERNKNSIDFAGKNTGLLLGECFVLGAAITSEWPESLPIVKNIGLNLGIALTMAAGCSDIHKVYVKGACQALMQLPKGIELHFFSEFINALFPQTSFPLTRQVVV